MEFHADQPRDTRNDTAILIALALGIFVLHTVTNGRYGFHRDELATLDDAHYLAWGYVAYPPLTPFLGRVSLDLFGNSVRGARFFPALAQAIAVFLSGLMARELGGRRMAQVVAALSVAIVPMGLATGALLQYVVFDYLWWVLTAYLLIRLLRTEDQRWWLAIGAVIGVGMLTKYTMLFLVAGIVIGLLFTNARRHLKSPWLWVGVAVSLLIFVPNLIWQVKHDFISLEFLRQIHERDVHLGRPPAFLPEQLWIVANPVTIPLWAAGLYFYFSANDGRRFRMIGWMFVVPLALFLVAKGRGYYIAPAYPMLLAAGAVAQERWLASMSINKARAWEAVTFALLAVSGVAIAAAALPVAPVRSHWFRIASRINGYFREEIGWPELVAEVAKVRDSLPADEIGQAAILAANYR